MPESCTITASYEVGPEDTARLVFTVPAGHREALRRIEGLVREGMRGGIYGFALRLEPDMSGMTHHTQFDQTNQ